MFQIIEGYKKIGIRKEYVFAVLIYFLPLISLGIFLLDQITIKSTDMVFWVLFLIGMIPCGIIGLTLSIIGLVKSLKKDNQLNKVIGVIGTVSGIICLLGGILGMMLIYIVVGG